METKEIKYLTNLCKVSFRGTHGIMIQSQYEKIERWFFLSNDCHLDGAKPDNWDNIKKNTGFFYSYILGTVGDKELTGPVKILYPDNIPKSAFKLTEPAFKVPDTDTDDGRPQFKQIILTPNKVR